MVIGAGVGGLTAAALLAQAGLDVTVLEAHVDPGGCAATFAHQGYHFDAGATLVGGFQPGGPHALVADRLGIDWPVRRSDPAMQVHLPDALVTRWGDPERWQAERGRAFPGTERFWQAQEWAADRLWAFSASAPPWPPQSPGDLVRLAARVQPGLIGLAPGVVGSVADWEDRLGTDDRAFRAFVDAQLLIAAQATAARVAPLYGAVALDLARQGVYHVKGGVGGIAETLVQAVRGQGGQVLFKRRVTRIERQAGRAVAVHAKRGPRHSPRPERFEADIVLANLTPWNLARLVEPEVRSQKSEVRSRNSDVRRQVGGPRPDTPMWGAFMLYLGVDEAAIPAGLPDHHQIVMDYDRPLGEGVSVFLSLSPTWDKGRAPAGQRAVTLSTHTRPGPWWELRERDHEGYLARRVEYTERLLRAAERVAPGVRAGIRLALPATPVTFEFYTGRELGMVGGFAQTSLFRSRGPRTATPNVFLVGDSIFPGQSTAGVTLGALRVVDGLLGQVPRRSKIGQKHVKTTL